jgi:endo-1,4-beta-mannosidase
MKRKPSVRLYRIEIKLITHSVWNYFDTKYSFQKALAELIEQNKNVIGYKYVKGEYKIVDF